MSSERRVLVTGHQGYIGSVLAPMLADRGYDVVGLDSGYFRECILVPPVELPTIERDIRDIQREDLDGVYAIVHLAALSNDPIGNLSSDWTRQINDDASVRLARLARDVGSERFLFSSSCIMYGMSEAVEVDETAPLKPQTEYARSKARSEAGIGELASDTFSPTYLRNGTVYGVSPRMRFDTVLNNLVASAVATGRVVVNGDGSPWRPVVHVEDVARAFIHVLEAPRELVHDQAFNTGANHLNHRVERAGRSCGRLRARSDARDPKGAVGRPPDLPRRLRKVRSRIPRLRLRVHGGVRSPRACPLVCGDRCDARRLRGPALHAPSLAATAHRARPPRQRPPLEPRPHGSMTADGMILTRTPLRLSLAGGGTDLPAFYELEDGAVLSSAIDHYIYVTVKRHGAFFDTPIRVNYAQSEEVEEVNQIENNIVRETLRFLDIDKPIYISTVGDLPASSGLGGSSSFTVGLLNALHAYRGERVTAGQLAEEASHIEIDILGEPIGKQDQYAAAFGGLNLFEFRKGGGVSVEPLRVQNGVVRDLFARVMLFWTGLPRDAGSVLREQSDNTFDRREQLRTIREHAFRVRASLSEPHPDLTALGRTISESGFSRKGWRVESPPPHSTPGTSVRWRRVQTVARWLEQGEEDFSCSRCLRSGKRRFVRHSGIRRKFVVNHEVHGSQVVRPFQHW